MATDRGRVENVFWVRGTSFRRTTGINVGDEIILEEEPENRFHNIERYRAPAIKVIHKAQHSHIGYVPAELCYWFSTHEIEDPKIADIQQDANIIKISFRSDDLCPRQRRISWNQQGATSAG